MSNHSMYINIPASDISQEMSKDPDFTANVLIELGYYLEGKAQRFGLKVAKVLQEEDPEYAATVIDFFKEVIQSFEEVKD